MILPDWPAPANVLAVSTEREALSGGGASEGDYASFNLGDHVGDHPDAVAANRRALLDDLKPRGVEAIQWLQQVHGTAVFRANEVLPNGAPPPEADAVMTDRRGLALAIMTADCLPVLFCDRRGTQVAAAHAGWRGLCQGVLAETIASFTCSPDTLMAWMGPAISIRHFEVGVEVRDTFLDVFSGPSAEDIARCFVSQPGGGDKFHADLYQLARLQLKSCGVAAIYGGQHCTFADESRFYSYRRQPRCGRQASLIALV